MAGGCQRTATASDHTRLVRAVSSGSLRTALDAVDKGDRRVRSGCHSKLKQNCAKEHLKERGHF